jgi:homoserine dehydrogenase
VPGCSKVWAGFSAACVVPSPKSQPYSSAYCDKFVNSIYKYAVKRNISLITANKAQLAEKGSQYYNLFDKNNLFLGFEAAVLGAVPVVRTISQAILPKKIKSIYGIFNGTSNYILSTMDKKNKNFDSPIFFQNATIVWKCC